MTLTQGRPAAAPEPVAESIAVGSAAAEGPQEVFLRPRRWTTAEYYALSDAGFFDDERVELLDGEIWTLPAHGTPHFSAVRRAVAFLEEVFGSGFDFRQQAPLTLEDGTEPEPDVLVVAGSWEDYEGHHPVPAEVRLLIGARNSTIMHVPALPTTGSSTSSIASLKSTAIPHRWAAAAATRPF